MQAQLKARSLKGVIWSAGEGAGVALLSFGAFLVMARWLEPRDFGIAALAGVFVFFCNLVLGHVFTDALVQRPDRGAVDRDPQAPGFAVGHERAVISSEDEEAVDRLARARDVDGIVSPGADWPVGIAARVAERIGLPHPIDARTGSIATSKARQRDAFAAAGVPHARALDPRDPALRRGQPQVALDDAIGTARVDDAPVLEHVRFPAKAQDRRPVVGHQHAGSPRARSLAEPLPALRLEMLVAHGQRFVDERIQLRVAERGPPAVGWPGGIGCLRLAQRFAHGE